LKKTRAGQASGGVPFVKFSSRCSCQLANHFLRLMLINAR
jgi:hypothetical protein